MCAVLHAILFLCIGAAATVCAETSQEDLSCASSARSSGPDLLQRKAAVRQGRKYVSELECPADCVVPAGENWLLDTSLQVETLKILGTLEWDQSKENLELRASYVLVEDGGHFILGTVQAPMQLSATVYITNGPSSHPKLGRRFLGGVGSGRRLTFFWCKSVYSKLIPLFQIFWAIRNSKLRYAIPKSSLFEWGLTYPTLRIDIHGRRLERTWSLLSETVMPGGRTLRLKDDPANMGWRVGDRSVDFFFLKKWHLLVRFNIVRTWRQHGCLT